MTDYLIKEDVFMALTGDITDCTIEEFIVRLREKLSKLPSIGKDINVTTNEDCKSRQAVLDEINRIGIKAFETYNDYSELYDFVDGLPPVTPKEKTGHWRHYEGMLICSECGTEFYDDIMEYCGDDVPKCCPNCGAKMVESQESEVRNDC